MRNNGAILKITAGFLCAAMLVTSFPITTCAEPAEITDEEMTEDVNSETEEAEKTEGTEEVNIAAQMVDVADMSEIRIGTLEEFNAFAEKCRLDSWSRDKYVILTDDIDCSQKKIEPIPTFGGVFEGNNHTLINVTFTKRECYCGLFSKTQPTAVIRNLNVIGVIKPGGKVINVGGIAGDNFGLIAGCRIDGYYDGYDYVGGVAGYNEAGAVISDCNVKGKISGLHYVGGIAGANAGLITGCSCEAEINTVNKDVETSLDDIKVEQIITSIITNVTNDEVNGKDVNSSTNPIDIGGIAGYNFGEISSCNNYADVGYEHVGYNVGGICGRQTGYVHDCSSEGSVCGRKDIGGIVGQAEPYIRLDLTEDIISQLTENINKLHDSLNQTIHDTNNSSDVVSARLNVIKDFADKALSDTGYLANGTQDFVNGVMATTNEAADRLEYVISETAKSDGALADLEKSGEEMSETAEGIAAVMDDLDIYNYMSETESKKYGEAKTSLTNGTREYKGYVEDFKASPDYTTAYDEGYSKSLQTLSDAKQEEYLNLEWEKTYEEQYTLKYDELVAAGSSEEDATREAAVYANIKADERKHDPDVILDAQNEAALYIATDTAKERAASLATTYANEQAAVYASGEYTKNHPGHTYLEDLDNNATTIASSVIDHVGDMKDDAIDDGKTTVDYADQMAKSLRDAAGKLKGTLSDVSGRGSLTFPELSDDFRGHTNSLVANIQGMSDNLGFLNNEMNGSTDVVCADMELVNDQFNTIMLLFTDAMDGVLDMDYSDIYEDESNDVAETSVDATITKCHNDGPVYGDINIGGIAGTMAQEYDFDLESDVTGVQDSSRNSTYRTKCVIRDDINIGSVNAGKSYAGGGVGLQEIGTVLRCENYGSVFSNSGDYVGGIAGESFATIRKSFSRCILKGGVYVGGITGRGVDILDCVSMPNISEASYYAGAIAGDADENGKLHSNFFVNEDLAGVDRISISGGAEPVEYDKLFEIDGVPEDFSQATVYYVVDDEVVQIVTKAIGEACAESDFTAYDKVELNDDEYILWDFDDNESVIKRDREIIGEKKRYRSSLASDVTRENGQSVFLADGRFLLEDDLLCVCISEEGEIGADRLKNLSNGASTLVDLIRSEDPEGSIEEHDADRFEEVYALEIPNDNASMHKIRYRKPEGIENVTISVRGGNEYEEVSAEDYGQYKVFTVSGNDVIIKITEVSNVKTYMGIILLAAVVGAVVLTIVIILIVRSMIKRRRKKKTNDTKPSE